MADINNPHELVDAIRRAIQSEAMQDNEDVPVIFVRLGGQGQIQVSEGDMLIIRDVSVEMDELGHHIEIVVVPDGTDEDVI